MDAGDADALEALEHLAPARVRLRLGDEHAERVAPALVGGGGVQELENDARVAVREDRATVMQEGRADRSDVRARARRALEVELSAIDQRGLALGEVLHS